MNEPNAIAELRRQAAWAESADNPQSLPFGMMLRLEDVRAILKYVESLKGEADEWRAEYERVSRARADEYRDATRFRDQSQQDHAKLMDEFVRVVFNDAVRDEYQTRLRDHDMTVRQAVNEPPKPWPKPDPAEEMRQPRSPYAPEV